MSGCLSFLFNMLGQISDLVLPWGLTFGATIAGIISIPVIFQFFRRLF